METGQPPATEEGPPQESIDDLMALNEEQWVERWKPLTEEFKKTGYFGPDGELLEVAPAMCADIALMRAIGLPMAKALNALAQGAQTEGEERYMRRFFDEMDTRLDELSKQGGAFEPLANNEMRAKFFGHLQQFNIDSDVLFDPDFLAGQWRAFNQAMFQTVEDDAATLAVPGRVTGRGFGLGTPLTWPPPAPVVPAPASAGCALPLPFVAGSVADVVDSDREAGKAFDVCPVDQRGKRIIDRHGCICFFDKLTHL